MPSVVGTMRLVVTFKVYFTSFTNFLSYLIFVTDATDGVCGEKIGHVEKFSP